MRKRYLNFLAMTISFFGSPFIVLALMFSALAWHYKDGVLQFYHYLLVTAIFVIIIPIAYMIETIPDVKLVDLHLEKKADRERVLLVVVFSVLIGYSMLSFIGMPKPLLLIELAGIFNLLIITIITFKMKLSIHLAVLTIAATLVIYLLGQDYLWLYSLIIPLGWARWYREKHTLAEIFVGIFLSFIVTFVIIKAFILVS